MVAIVLATGISHLLSGDTIYTLKLRRRGVDLSVSPSQHRMQITTVAEVMTPGRDGGPGAHPARRPRPDAAARVPRPAPDLLPAGAYQGVVTARTVAEMLSQQGGAAGRPATWPSGPPTSLPTSPSTKPCRPSRRAAPPPCR